MNKNRLFLELTTGCEHLTCSSPCHALNVSTRNMPNHIAEILIKKVKFSNYQIFLFGLGDSSNYPYKTINKKLLTNCQTHITEPFIIQIPSIPKELELFVRIDTKLNKKQWRILLNNNNVQGLFSVIHIHNIKELILVAKKALENNLPFMFRSLQFSEFLTPTRSELLKLMLPFQPKDVFDYHNLPRQGCNSKVIKWKDGLFFVKPCTLQNPIYSTSSIEILHQYLKISPDFTECSCCTTYTKPNYRVYYEPHKNDG